MSFLAGAPATWRATVVAVVSVATFRRSLGTRTALLVGLAFLMVSAALLPSSPLTIENARHAVHYAHSAIHTTPLNGSELSRPRRDTCMIAGKEWEECGEGDVLCAKYGENALRASRTYTGPEVRLRAVMRKALKGEPIKLGVLGGSVSIGHGIPHGQEFHIYHQQIWKWFQGAFPQTEVSFSNGAVAGQGSDFHKLCFHAHMDEDVDLILIDAAINDFRKDQKAALDMEWLMRGLLDLPKKPAVVHVQTLAVMFEMISLGGDLHTPIAEYYGAPVISLRPVLLPILLNDPSKLMDYYFTPGDIVDTRHIGIGGHDMLADLVISYFQSVYCSLSHEPKRGYLTPPETDMPPQLVFSRFNATNPPPTYAPMCNSTQSTLRLLSPTSTSGFALETFNGKSYWTGYKPGDRIEFDVEVRAKGTVTLDHVQSKTYGLGIIRCWLDGDEASGAYATGWWDDPRSVGQSKDIASNVAPGWHPMTCQIQTPTHDPDGGTKFMIAAVISA